MTAAPPRPSHRPDLHTQSNWFTLLREKKCTLQYQCNNFMSKACRQGNIPSSLIRQSGPLSQTVGTSLRAPFPTTCERKVPETRYHHDDASISLCYRNVQTVKSQSNRVRKRQKALTQEVGHAESSDVISDLCLGANCWASGSSYVHL